jgi:hypothetical protein
MEKKPGTLSALLPVLFLLGCQASNASSRTAASEAASRGVSANVVVVPEGTELAAELRTALSSASNRPGDLVVALVTEDVRLGQRVVVPHGSELRGRVTAAIGSGKVKGRARLAFEFDRLVVDGRETEVEARGADITAGDTRKRDAAVVGGGAAGGAIIGGIAKGGKGAAIGALLGGAAGTGVVLATKGKEVELPAGTSLRTHLLRELRL